MFVSTIAYIIVWSTYGCIPSTQKRPIGSYRDAVDSDFFFRDKLVGAFILAQIPDAHTSGTVAGNKLALVRVDHHIRHRASMMIIALNGSGARIPYFDGSIFGARHHPFALAVERNSGNVAGVSVERQHWAWIVGVNVIELHILRSGRSEILLIG